MKKKFFQIYLVYEIYFENISKIYRKKNIIQIFSQILHMSKLKKLHDILKFVNLYFACKNYEIMRSLHECIFSIIKNKLFQIAYIIIYTWKNINNFNYGLSKYAIIK